MNVEWDLFNSKTTETENIKSVISSFIVFSLGFCEKIVVECFAPDSLTFADVLQMLDEMPELDTQKLYDIILQLPHVQGCVSG